MKVDFKKEKRYRKHKKVRAKISGLAKKPRLCVFRSNKHIYAQLIDDEKNSTLLTARDQELRGVSRRHSQRKDSEEKTEEKIARRGKLALAFEVGKLIAQKAIKNKIEKVVFDRGGYQYHGIVKALAEGAREGGLKF